MFKSIQVLLAGIFTMGLVACGSGGGGATLDSTVENARSKGVNIRLSEVREYVYDKNGEYMGHDAVVGRTLDVISLKSVGPTDAEMLAAIEALRAVDAMIEGSNLLNKQEAHTAIENAIYDLQQKRKELLEKGNGSVSEKSVHP